MNDVDRLVAELQSNSFGRGNSVGGVELAKDLGLKNDRALRKVVSEARKTKRGHDIRSYPGRNAGYWWPDGSREDEHAIKWQRDMGFKYLGNVRNIQKDYQGEATTKRGMDKGEYEQLTLGC